MKRKEFDAIEMMRKIRDDLSQEYLENPEGEEIDLQQIRERYAIALPRAKTTAQK